MCGIFGIYSKKLKTGKISKLCQKSISSLSHRGPDDRGFWIGENIGLAHTRLSILDVKNGKQPMQSLNNRYLIIYNGEIVNHQNLRSILKKNKVELSTKNSDTETVLELYSLLNYKMLNKLNGMFSISIFDKKNKEIFLARDSVGIKPLYYYYDKDHFAFSSEIKTLSKILNKKLIIDKRKLFEFLIHGNVIGEKTIYKNIFQLEPGSFLKFKDRKIKIRYFNNTEEKNKIKKIKTNKLKIFLNKIVKEWTISDVGISSLLSGGLDSSLVSKIASQYNSKINLFTAYYPNEKAIQNTDLKLSKITAKTIKKKSHQFIGIKVNQIKKNIEKYVHHTLEPVNDLNTLTLMEICEKIKKLKKYKVLLTGDGADEVFGGYSRHYTIFKKYLISHKAEDIIMANNYLSVQKLKKLCKFNYKISKYRSNIFKKINSNDDKINTILKYEQKTFFRGYLDRLDKVGMMYGLEIRPPFLDTRLINLVNELKSSKKIIQKKNKVIWYKYLLRKLAVNTIPQKIIWNRTKYQFFFPAHSLFKEQKYKKVVDFYFNKKSKIKKYFNYLQIKKLVVNHRIGISDNSNILGRLLSIEILLRKI